MKKRILMKLSGKSIGSLGQDPIWQDIFAVLKENDIEIVIVHGAGKQIDEFLNKQNKLPQYINGKRITDLETLKAMIAVQNGTVNSLISKKLTELSVPNVSLSSYQNKMFIVEKREEKYGYVGKSSLWTNLDSLKQLLSAKFTPIISSLCIDRNFHFINVNADEFTLALCKELDFDEVYLLSDYQSRKVFR